MEDKVEDRGWMVEDRKIKSEAEKGRRA